MVRDKSYENSEGINVMHEANKKNFFKEGPIQLSDQFPKVETSAKFLIRYNFPRGAAWYLMVIELYSVPSIT